MQYEADLENQSREKDQVSSGKEEGGSYEEKNNHLPLILQIESKEGQLKAFLKVQKFQVLFEKLCETSHENGPLRGLKWAKQESKKELDRNLLLFYSP